MEIKQYSGNQSQEEIKRVIRKQFEINENKTYQNLWLYVKQYQRKFIATVNE